MISDTTISQSLWHPYTQMASFSASENVIVRGDGAWVWDRDGRRYFDGISGLWNVNLGHRRREIIDAISRQLDQLDFFPLNGFAHEPALNLADRLTAIAPSGLDRVFLTPGGGEAADTAIKMSRRFWKLSGQPERHCVLSLQGAYHGSTFGALSAAGLDVEKDGFEPLLEGFHVAPDAHQDPDATQLRALIERIGAGRVASIMLEPVQGVGGAKVVPSKYLEAVQALADTFGFHIIVDEIATGFGRTGRMFACVSEPIRPDFMLISKALTNGSAPLGAVLTTNEVYEAYLGTADSNRALMHGFTFGGHPASCSAALACLDLHAAERPELRAADTGQALKMAIEGIAARSQLLLGVSGRGLMLALEFDDRASVDVDGRLLSCAGAAAIFAQRRGVIARTIGHRINLMPVLTASDDEFEFLISAMAGTITDIEMRAKIKNRKSLPA